MTEELTRLAEPEDLDVISQSMEYIQSAFPADLIHAVSPDSDDIDTNSYAVRIVETLEA